MRVYLCLTLCDMRKSFDSLQALVRDHLELDAFAGHLFVFANRRKDRVKVLYWDRDGKWAQPKKRTSRPEVSEKQELTKLANALGDGASNE